MSDEEVLKRLAEIRNNPDELEKFHAPEWIWREVLASMRLSDDAVEQSVQADVAYCDCKHPWLICLNNLAMCRNCGNPLRR